MRACVRACVRAHWCACMWVITLVLGLSLLKFIIMCDDDILAIQYL